MLAVNGGKMFWARADFVCTRGVVVIFPRVSLFNHHQRQQQQNQLDFFVLLISSLHWDVLVCYSHFITLFNPEKAESLAGAVLNELVQELRRRPNPVIFMTFFDGTKACLYKVFQILQGTCGARLATDDVRLVRDCVAGHIFDSAPVDFSWYIGSHFSMLPSMFKLPGSLRLGSWIARGLGCGLDAIFLTNFESQRSGYWDALYSSVDFGAPYLILCAQDDDKAPYEDIFRFSQRITSLGGDAKLLTFSTSAGCYNHHTEEYKVEIRSLLERASVVYSSKKGMKTVAKDEISELISGIHEAMVCSDNSRLTGGTDDLFPDKSNEVRDGGGWASVENEVKQGTPESHPGVGGHGILSQVLFDACVPKNIEGWDIMLDGSVNGRPFTYARRRRSPLQAIKGICRSKL